MGAPNKSPFPHHIHTIMGMLLYERIPQTPAAGESEEDAEICT